MNPINFGKCKKKLDKTTHHFLKMYLNESYCKFFFTKKIHSVSFIKSFITGDSVAYAYHLWHLTALWQGLILFILTRKYLNPYIIHKETLVLFF